MKKILTLLPFLLIGLGSFAQNVGIGTVTPTNTLHVVPQTGTDPLRIDGLKIFSTENFFLVIDTVTGIVKHMPTDSLISLIGDSIDTDIDSLKFINDTLYLYEDDKTLTTYINSSLDTALVDSLIYSKVDSLYSFISDSLLNDTTWLNQLRDSINTDDQNIDSLTLTGTILTTYIENGNSGNVDLQPIIDSAIANASGADNDWDVNANGTGLEGNPGTNTASGTNSIAAGTGNTASGNYGVSFGFNNNVTGDASVVAGGLSNTVSADQSVVSGGGSNNSTAIRTTVSGGGSNTASANSSTVSGGWSNTASADMSTVSGGRFNVASGMYSTVGGGQYNTAQSYGEWVGGLYSITGAGNAAAYVATDRLFVIGNGTSTVARSNALTVLKNGNTGIGDRASVLTPTNKLHLAATGGDPLRIEDLQYGGTADSVLVTDATGVVKLASIAKNKSNFISIINNATILTADNTEVVFINSTANTVQVTMPDATTNSGRRIILKWTNGGFAATVVSVSTIDASSAMVGFGDDIEYMSDGVQWWVIRR